MLLLAPHSTCRARPLALFYMGHAENICHPPRRTTRTIYLAESPVADLHGHSRGSNKRVNSSTSGVHGLLLSSSLDILGQQRPRPTLSSIRPFQRAGESNVAHTPFAACRAYRQNSPAFLFVETDYHYLFSTYFVTAHIHLEARHSCPLPQTRPYSLYVLQHHPCW